VDRRHREAPQLEVRLLHAGIGDDVHPQSRAQVVVLAVEKAPATVEHVVHGHDRCGSQRRVVCLGGQGVGRLGANLVEHLRVPGSRGARQQRAPQLLLVELGRATNRAQVELEVLGVLRQRFFEVFYAHLASSVDLMRSGLNQADCLSSSVASSVGSPLRQLQAHSSSDCRASRTRSTSSTLRPTEPAVTETNWISLLGSTRKVARSATPSALSTPVLRLSSRLMSESIGKGNFLRSSCCARQLKCTNSLSIDTPSTCASRSSNSSLSLPNAAISVGHTK